MAKRDWNPTAYPTNSDGSMPTENQRLKRQGGPSAYPPASDGAMPIGNRRIRRQDDPSAYPTDAWGPMPTGNRMLQRDYEPVPYPEPTSNGGIPIGNRVMERDYQPSTYPTAPPNDPMPVGSKLLLRDGPSAYPTASDGPMPIGNKLLKRQYDPEPYPTPSNDPMPSGNKVKRVPQVTSSGTVTVTPAATTTSTQASNLTTRWPYVQLGGSSQVGYGWYFPQATIAAANYNSLCPSGKCATDCQNMQQVFQAFPDGLDKPNYGKAHSNGSLPDITLFGICSNLGLVSDLAQTQYPNTTFASYFPSSGQQTALRDVSNDISLCLIDTCQHTRDPTQCINQCSFNNLQGANSSIAVPTGVYPCMKQLCRNTCGLPFADQDVYGVGVLASYITQAILVLLMAIVLIFFASWRYFKKSDTTKYQIPRRMKYSLELFLATECYFGISAAIASYLMRPATVDPLNGYALLSVSITGFIPPVFTLMLIHQHGVRSWYTTILTFTSWVFSTLLFFMLVKNLAQAANNPRAIDAGLNSLFKIDSCGLSSAMSLCQQTFDTDPLAYLSWFYNYWSIPSIRTVPILWVLSTIVLICLVTVQLYDHIRPRPILTPDLETTQPPTHRKFTATISLLSLYIGSILFGLALGYQACMVLSFTRMDVIDWHGWTFGQVVAVLFWAPALVNCFRSYVLESSTDPDLPPQHLYTDTYPPEKQAFTYTTEPFSPDSTTSVDMATSNDKIFFSASPSNPSLHSDDSAAAAATADQSVRVPADMLFGNFGRGRKELRNQTDIIR